MSLDEGVKARGLLLLSCLLLELNGGMPTSSQTIQNSKVERKIPGSQNASSNQRSNATENCDASVLVLKKDSLVRDPYCYWTRKPLEVGREENPLHKREVLVFFGDGEVIREFWFTRMVSESEVIATLGKVVRRLRKDRDSGAVHRKQTITFDPGTYIVKPDNSVTLTFTNVPTVFSLLPEQKGFVTGNGYDALHYEATKIPLEEPDTN